MDAIIFDVHLMQASLHGSILDSNSAILVIRYVRRGNLARWHSDLTFSREKQTVSHSILGFNQSVLAGVHKCLSPVISPFWMVNGMTRSNGLRPATSRPFIPIGLSVAWETEGRGQTLSGDEMNDDYGQE